MAYGLLEQDRIVTRDVLQVVTQGLAQEESNPKPREQKSSNARTVTEKRRVLRQLNRRAGFFDRLDPTTGFCKPKFG